MNPYIIGLIVLVILGIAGFGVYYYLYHYRKGTGSIEHDYVWVGPGEHPFKGKKEE